MQLQILDDASQSDQMLCNYTQAIWYFIADVHHGATVCWFAQFDDASNAGAQQACSVHLVS